MIRIANHISHKNNKTYKLIAFASSLREIGAVHKQKGAKKILST